ncbi:hypothetical protein [Actinoplanes subglobosus]|uniref:Uncharacterized protein n=1 Tax=Actinoplanes subglobosus TaxID=1547892 RepID=A0ABV8JC26_9ACTN
MIKSFAQRHRLTLPDEATARMVADLLAERGHGLVAVRIAGQLDGRQPPPTPGLVEQWQVFSLVIDPAMSLTDDNGLVRNEERAIARLAREHRGVSSSVSGAADIEIQGFSRAGLVHELDPGVAGLRRIAVNASASARLLPLPEPPALKHLVTTRGAAEVAVIADVTQRLATESGDDTVWIEASADAEVDDILGDLLNEALHQDHCMPWTAARVPLFAALAADLRVTDFHRAWLLADLFDIATVGRRHLASATGETQARGLPSAETPDTLAARAAVAAVLPTLAACNSDSELTRYMRAALGAACPEAAVVTTAEIEELHARYAGSARAPVVEVIGALVRSDEAGTQSALDRLEWMEHWVDNPFASAEYRGLALLSSVLADELSRSVPA